MCSENPGRKMELQVQRDGQVFNTWVVPEWSPMNNRGDIGVKFAYHLEITHKCGSKV